MTQLQISTQQSAVHPATAVTLAACGWMIVLVAAHAWVSFAVLAAALILGMWAGRSIGLVTMTAVLTLPVALSMLLIHAPYGHHHVAPLITTDGLVVAGKLTFRFSALMACVLAAAAATRVTDIAKWLQGSVAGHRAGYIVGSALQTLPEGRRAVSAVRDAREIAGKRNVAGPLASVRGAVSEAPAMVMPVISRLLTTGVQRGRGLSALGFDNPGKRTVLLPVPDSTGQKTLRWVGVLATLVIVGALLWI